MKKIFLTQILLRWNLRSVPLWGRSRFQRSRIYSLYIYSLYNSGRSPVQVLSSAVLIFNVACLVLEISEFEYDIIFPDFGARGYCVLWILVYNLSTLRFYEK